MKIKTIFEQAGHRLLIAVPCIFGQAPVAEMSMLDTGCEWTVLSPDTADSVSAELVDRIESVAIGTRDGRFEGQLYRLSVRIPDDGGLEFIVDATVAILEGWARPTVLGYRGFLEHLRIALDPGGQTSPARLNFDRTP